MTTSGAERRSTHKITAVGLAVAVAAIIGTFVVRTAPSAAPSINRAHHHQGGTARVVNGAVTEADGVLPDGVTAFDGSYPGVANLDSDLLAALRRAARDAAADGIELHLNSGWRSPTYQEQLFEEAVARYGSAKRAARWVATAQASSHVSGKAVDIGSSDARAWLSEHGAAYGLCQIYKNESWHYELRPEATVRGCPSMYADATHDPRMQR